MSSFHEFYVSIGAKFPEPNLNDMSLDILSGIVAFRSEFKGPSYIGEQHFIAAYKSQKHFNYMMLLRDFSFQECNVLENKSPHVEELLAMLPHDEKTSECAICLDDMKSAEDGDALDSWDRYYKNNFECHTCTFHAHKNCVQRIVVDGRFNCPQCREEYYDVDAEIEEQAAVEEDID